MDNDYGCDPVGDGTYRMVPSGDIVDKIERDKRLGAEKTSHRKESLIGAYNSYQVQIMQGGKLK